MPKDFEKDYMKEAKNFLDSKESLESLSTKFSVDQYSPESLNKRKNYDRSYYSFKEFDSFKSDRSNVPG